MGRRSAPVSTVMSTSATAEGAAVARTASPIAVSVLITPGNVMPGVNVPSKRRQALADAVGELRRALLEERGHALARVGRLAAGVHRARVRLVRRHGMGRAEHVPEQ